MLGTQEALLLGGGALLKEVCHCIGRTLLSEKKKKEKTFPHHNKENTEETEEALVNMFTDFLRNGSLSLGCK